MTALSYSVQILETRLRIERAERRATLLASRGPLSKPGKMRPFARRVAPLAGAVEVWHAAGERAAAPGTQKAA